MKLLVGLRVVWVIVSEGLSLLEVRSHAKRIDFRGHGDEVLHNLTRLFVDGMRGVCFVIDLDSEQIKVLHAANLDIEVLELLLKRLLSSKIFGFLAVEIFNEFSDVIIVVAKSSLQCVSFLCIL